MSNKRFPLDVLARKTLVESYYVCGLETTVRFLVGRVEDAKVIEEYVQNTCNDVDLKHGLVEHCLSTENVILVTDCFELCGLVIGIQNEKNLQIQLFQLQKEYQWFTYSMVKEVLKLAIQRSFKQVVFNDNLGRIFNELSQNATIKRSIDLELDDLSAFLVDDTTVLPEAYKLPNINRSTLKSIFVQRLGRNIDFVMARAEDKKAVKNYMINEYYRQTSVLRALQCPKDEIQDLVKNRANFQPLEDGTVILALDDGKICGLCLSRTINTEQETSKFSQIKKVPIDFDVYIDELPTERHLSLRTLGSFCLCAESRIGEFVDNDCKSFFRINNLSVHPSYQNCKIASTLCREAVNIAKQKGLTCIEILATGFGTRKIAEALGMEEKITIEYANVEYKGKRLFPENIIYDNGTSVGMFVGRF